MEIKTFNPWSWQDARSYSQAVEVKNNQSTLYVSGQAAISEDGISSTASMKSQLVDSLNNLEKVINHAGYSCENIVHLTIYTTSTTDLLNHFEIFQQWITSHNIKQALTVLEVAGLFETLKVELEATLVK